MVFFQMITEFFGITLASSQFLHFTALVGIYFALFLGLSVLATSAFFITKLVSKAWSFRHSVIDPLHVEIKESRTQIGARV